MAIYCKKKYIFSLILSLISFFFMLSFLFYEKILVRGMPENIYAKISGYGFGYWIWLLSVIILIVGICVLIKKKI